MESEIRTVTVDMLDGLEAAVLASRRETIPFGLAGENLGCGECPPAVSNSNAEKIDVVEEIFRESTLVFEA